MTKAPQKNFGEQFEELEKIARKFEDQEQLDLDQSVKDFEKGLALAQELKERLADVEMKVKKIQEKFSHK